MSLSSECVAREKCWRRGGACKEHCSLHEEEIVKGCKGEGCHCCVSPPDPGKCLPIYKILPVRPNKFTLIKKKYIESCCEINSDGYINIFSIFSIGCHDLPACYHGRGECREWCLHGETQADADCGPTCKCCLSLSEGREHFVQIIFIYQL